MKNFRQLIVAVVICTLSIPSFATSKKEKRESQTLQVFYYSPSDPMNIAIVDFITLTPEQHYLEPTAPRFLLTDSQHKFALGIGGVIRGVTSVDFAGIIPSSMNNGFTPALIPSSKGTLPESQAMMSAATSEIFIKMVGDTKTLGMFSIYASMNFMGENYTPQLRNAYVEFLGFRVGQSWSTFTDLNALPPTIDYAGPSSYAGYHIPQIRYTRLFGREKFQFAIAAEYPTVNATYSTTTVEQSQGVPNIVGYLQANFNEGGHLRVSGLYRNMNYKDLETWHTDRKEGWGVQLSGLSKIAPALTFYYQGIYGKGITRYMNDLSNMSYDMLPNENILGEMVTPETWGAYGGLKWDICDDVYTSFTYSYSRIYSDKDFDTTDMYKYTQYYVANIFWELTEECTVGIEYLRGNKTFFGGDWEKANRANLVVQYNF